MCLLLARQAKRTPALRQLLAELQLSSNSSQTTTIKFPRTQKCRLFSAATLCKDRRFTSTIFKQCRIITNTVGGFPLYSDAGSRQFHSGSGPRRIAPSWILREGEDPTAEPNPEQKDMKKNKKGADDSAMEGNQRPQSTPVKKRKRIVDADSIAPPTTPAGVVEMEVEDSQGSGFSSEWPAAPRMLSAAREFILKAGKSPHPVLLIPDRDADGLCAGTIVSLTLKLLGKPLDKIHVHFVRKGRSIFDQAEKAQIEQVCRENGVADIIILDQGSREGTEALVSSSPPPRSKAPRRKTLIIDHHYSTSFTPNATILTSQNHSPVAPTSLLAYVCCAALHPDAQAATALPALIGTLGDLSSSPKTLEMLRSPPVSTHFDAAAALKKYTATWINKLISLLNVARRSPLIEGEEATRAAWYLLQFDPHSKPSEWPTPKLIMSGTWGSPQLRDTVIRLTTLQERSRAETDKWKRAPPKFSSDGRIALVEIASGWQIHPLLAAMWVGTLGSKNAQDPNVPKLLAVAVANRDYVPGKVNFSVRRTAYAGENNVNLITLLKEYADRLPLETREAMGEDFARGHKEASGGSLEKEV